MDLLNINTITILALQGSIVAITVLLFYRLKDYIGMSVIYICLGLMHFHATILVSSSISAGEMANISLKYFLIQSASLIGLLLIYIKEDAGECRQLLYGIPAASLFLGILLYLFSISSISESVSYIGLIVLWKRLIQTILVEAFIYTVSGILIIMSYEYLSQRFHGKMLWLRLFLAGTAAFTLQGLGSFQPMPRELPLPLDALPIDVSTRLFMCLLYATLIYIYLRLFEADKLVLADSRTIREVWEVITFQKPFEFFIEERQKDQLTEVYNMAFLSRVLPGELMHAQRTNRPLSLIRLEIDQFRAYNEEAGLHAGDKVLRALGQHLLEMVRSSDLVVRSTSEEFILLLNNMNQENSLKFLEKNQVRFFLTNRACLEGEYAVHIVDVVNNCT